MSTSPPRTEEQVVRARFQAQQDKTAAERGKSLMLALLAGVACFVLWYHEFWAFALCALLVAMIGGSNYLTANGYLHHLRSTAKLRKTLVRDFSKLAPDQHDTRDPKSAAPSTP